MRLALFLLALLLAFILDAPILEALSRAPEGVARAAEYVTWIGKTDWQALALITVMLGAALARPSAVAAQVLRVAVACFLLTLLTGLAVQALKYGFGRPRPAALGEMSVLTFAPFSFQRGRNAFPSGHSTTMGALAVLVTRVRPGAWAYAWGLAVIVGISRALVGAHYPSDIVAGLALGAVMAAWMLDRWQITAPFWATDAPMTGLTAIPRSFARMLAALGPRRT